MLFCRQNPIGCFSTNLIGWVSSNQILKIDRVSFKIKKVINETKSQTDKQWSKNLNEKIYTHTLSLIHIPYIVTHTELEIRDRRWWDAKQQQPIDQRWKCAKQQPAVIDTTALVPLLLPQCVVTICCTSIAAACSIGYCNRCNLLRLNNHHHQVFHGIWLHCFK